MKDQENAEVSEAMLACEARSSQGEERALVERARHGDTAAFEELYVRGRDQTYNLCLSLCADREDAQDLLQETFVRAYRFLPRFRGDAQFSTWLHRITVNLYRDRRRLQQQEARLPPPPRRPSPTSPPPSGCAPRSPACSRTIASCWPSAIARLSPTRRWPIYCTGPWPT